MIKIKVGLIGALLIVLMSQLTACWNYREIEKLAIVAGFGVDQNPDTGQYMITAEVIEIHPGGKEKQILTTLVSSEGDTLFDAARNLISITGNRLYWSHAKVLIISKEIAEKSLISVLDFGHRDVEVRYDIDLLVSVGKASSIFQDCHSYESGVLSYKITNTLLSEKNLSKAPMSDEWKFVNDMEDADHGSILPVIQVTEENDKRVPEIMGTGVIKGDKLVGVLTGEETKTLLLIINRIKGGLLVIQDHDKSSEAKVALEIFKNKTNIKPEIKGQHIMMKIKMQTEVSLGESTGKTNFNKEENLKKLQKDAEGELEEKVLRLIKKVQKEYGSDIFGLGNAIRIREPNAWDLLKKDWDAGFALAEIDVQSEIKIRNTGFMARPIKVGE